jgi:hypothetical protein
LESAVHLGEPSRRAKHNKPTAAIARTTIVDVAAATQLPERRPTRSGGWLLLPLAAFALVALAVGLVAHEKTVEPGAYPSSYVRLFFSDPLHLKAWFATSALALAVFQMLTAAWIFRKLPFRRPNWVAPLHRWSGRLAFTLTLPVAYNCIFLLGFQTTTNRVLIHSLLGCAVYGAFAAKVLIVRLHRYPSWVLPTAGSLLFATLIGVWYTSALWLFQLVGVGL